MTKKRFLVALALVAQTCLVQANDNLLAHRLYTQGNYVQAAEIFTDPAWKGLALYRSAQWWRAAEAFVRANDPVSAFNLGNCYVKLGYFALALDAYQRALSLDPSLDDARHNADIMRKLLQLNDNGQQSSGGQPQANEIDRLETEEETPESGNAAGEEPAEINDKPRGDSGEQGEQATTPNNNAQAGRGDDSAKREQLALEQDDNRGSVQGETTDTDPGNKPSGGSETDTSNPDSQAAGLRSAIEAEQATTQWLNRIQHDSQLFLSRRIKLEDRRRRAAGQTAPAGGSAW